MSGEYKSKKYRKERREGHVTVHYGKDRVTGFFIKVTDDRLCAAKSYAGIDTKDLDWDFLKKIAGLPESDSGRYLSAHTGVTGFGHKTNIPTMGYLWKLFGASDEDMRIFATGHDGVM